jgi:phosphoribosylformylglycinamidine cyclo-ligase
MQNESYRAAGVDVNAGYEAVRLMKSDIERTFACVGGSADMGEFGNFGGMFIPDLAGMEEPVLVSGTDGVGTKLKVAHLMDKHDTVGIDLVAMCVNDIICCGAKPLFFLDYINCEKNIPEKIAEIVKGIADGCVEAGCALVGGETAEHPLPRSDSADDYLTGSMKTEIYEYDLAGFCVGIADKKNLIGKTAKEGDILIGLASSGVHSNGFSLIRKVFNIISRSKLNTILCDTLLTPTKIYAKPVLSLIEQIEVKGIANITGGGFYENIPRCLPEGLTAEIMKNSYEIPEIFADIAETGEIPEGDMYCTFNMGIGMVCVVSPENAEKAVKILGENNVKAYCIGKIIPGNQLVLL